MSKQTEVTKMSSAELFKLAHEKLKSEQIAATKQGFLISISAVNRGNGHHSYDLGLTVVNDELLNFHCFVNYTDLKLHLAKVEDGFFSTPLIKAVPLVDNYVRQTKFLDNHVLTIKVNQVLLDTREK